MKGERKLSLVKPPAHTGDEPAASAAEELAKLVELPDGEPPLDEAELLEAEALRAALERGDDPFAAELRAAFAPGAIAEPDLDAILARAMGDTDAAGTSLEQAGADRLRAALDEHDAQRVGTLILGPGARSVAGRSEDRDDDGAGLAVALRAAWAPSPIGASKNDALVSKALDVAAPGATGSASASASKGAEGASGVAARRGGSSDGAAPLSLRRFRMGPRAYGTMAAVVAMAAGVLLFVGRFGEREAAPPASVAQAPAPAATAVAARDDRAPRIASRSTDELFDAATPFPRQGGESARVDRIAGARAADLRANRFASWGVR